MKLLFLAFTFTHFIINAQDFKLPNYQIGDTIYLNPYNNQVAKSVYQYNSNLDANNSTRYKMASFSPTSEVELFNKPYLIEDLVFQVRKELVILSSGNSKIIYAYNSMYPDHFLDEFPQENAHDSKYFHPEFALNYTLHKAYPEGIYLTKEDFIRKKAKTLT